MDSIREGGQHLSPGRERGFSIRAAGEEGRLDPDGGKEAVEPGYILQVEWPGGLARLLTARHHLHSPVWGR